ncbi:hypothetical protein LUZ61_008464 [Rhynchospora tenuis]|uniref:Uncharacterized protein n=1 Tax=Rhynchospora tenuis TaxID=198213 RepID=A0AAD5ZVL0_9POAL|nr:hypothetical protein LUZ61_008464 [Rhynchospora tenuis]
MMDNTDPTISSLEAASLNGETDPNKETVPSNHHEESKSTTENPENSVMKKKRGRKKGQKLIRHEVDETRYAFRSSVDGGRVLRSMSNGKSESPNPDQNPNNELVAGTSSQIESVSGMKKRGRKPKNLSAKCESQNPTYEFAAGTSSQIEPVSGKKRRGRKPNSSGDKLSTIRNRIRSLVTRMNYEQNLIDAYSTDGWKGQSLEKLRPEKEIDRAKAAIIKCKLKIRDSFKELGVLAAEGKLNNFDEKGEIDCDDIFCAKCGLKNVTLNNDIILCDGICDRGFHQMCLSPPLLTKDIPPGDEGWLCPACDCKLDCIVLLNESKGSNLCLQDTWEKVFPEAAAAANGTSQLDASDLPSDDSEDDDYNPDATGEDNEEEDGGEDHGEESDQEDSSSDDSDFYTDSDDEKFPKKAKNQKKQLDIEALPSEDSEDDDFDPERRNSEEENSEKVSNSDESDFTSDSDEFCDELVKTSDGDKDIPTQPFGQEMDDHNEPMVGRRQREPTDYKKLYRETFGKASSESSDDEDWSENRINKGKGYDLQGGSSPKRSRSSKNKRNFGLDKTKTLKEYFETNQYPTRESKEILAEELELTYEQVNKWFEAARRQARGTSEEMSNGLRRRGRPAKTSVNMTVTGISGVHAPSASPLTPNSAMYAQKTLPRNLGMFTPNQDIRGQKSPPRSVGTMYPNSTMTIPNPAVNVQKTPPTSVGTSKGTVTPKDFMDSERKKAIMRELRKQKMGR